MIIKCSAITCKYCKEGKCNAESIELTNEEYWDETEKTYKDFQKCDTYEYSSDWIK